MRISAGKAWEFDTPKASIPALFAPHIKREVRRNLTKTKTPPRTITGLSCRAPIGAHGIDLKMPVFIGLQADFWRKAHDAQDKSIWAVVFRVQSCGLP